MADDLNSLLQAQHASTVLSGIMNPAQVNPLAALNSATQTAGGIYDLRDKQGQGLWGQALQQSTDPATGVVDYNKANRIAATMGPEAAQAAARNLQNNSALTGAQISQATALHGLLGNMSMSLMNDPSDENLAKIRASAVASNLPPGTLTEIDRLAALPAAQRGAEAYKHALSNLDTLGQLARGGYPAPALTTVGSTAVPVGVTPGSPYGGPQATVGGGGVSLGLTPDQLAQPHTWKDENGNPQQGTVGEFLKTLGVQIPTGGQQVPGGGRGDTSPLATVPNAATLASPNKSPNATPPTTASPNVGKSIKAPSDADIDTQKAGAGMGVALTQRAGLVPENRSNLGSMLTDANALDTMGAGSTREAYLNSFFQKWTGTGLLGNASQQQIAKAESFAKIANIMAASQMSSLGASDSRQQLAIGANPHLDLSKMGNEQIIHMLQGNEDAIAAKSGAWEDWKLSHGSGSYAQFQNELNKDFDLRVFQQRYMSPPEIDAMKKQMQSQGTDKEFIRKVLVARQRGWIQ